MKTNDLILKTVSRGLVYFIFALSIYIMLKGHNEPGGGFIGGLMTAAAFVLLFVTFGAEEFRRIVPINFQAMTIWGLAIAAVSGVIMVFKGLPFLTHTMWKVSLPILGKTYIGTTLFFDTGVYLVVIGGALILVQTIGED
ncbi:Na(+)/H(+) antiporter subunit B [Desulfuribacillus stibiiarsenatis]|uniref:Na(+)/H(+) antiporter subunit B n=1 Tax=Desulfuribacillus stibiiarsenatis TaxID=1390249 RepID=A0A1E5L362_9FIRM|nr:MnhB domain-containing protein [Desulfuribacillus stibiiarsenatis]OEH84580.1 Na(+)/H(+) antiporter subunit B [Desulfuribacillus stibiiarsenatis]